MASDISSTLETEPFCTAISSTASGTAMLPAEKVAIAAVHAKDDTATTDPH